MRTLSAICLVAGLAGLAAGCDPPQAMRQPGRVAPHPGPPPTARAPAAASSVPEPEPGAANPEPPHPSLAITDVVTLRSLERRGFDFASLALSNTPGVDGAQVRRSASDYAKHAAYADVVETLSADLDEFTRADRRLGVGMRYAHRAFDRTWLRSEQFSFELAGIVNRIDRRAFTPHTCGEIRFIFRLTYEADVQGQRITSRVPMTINVVRFLDDDGRGCLDHLDRWRVPPLAGEALAEALLQPSALLDEFASRTHEKSLEVNLQSVRWPSTVRPNMAGHAEYVLRVFSPMRDAAGRTLRYRPQGLENTPSATLRTDASLRAEFLAWLREPGTLRALDEGTLRMPERFLATRAISVAPHGLARLQNRPASSVVGVADLSDLDLPRHHTISNPELLRRRLDGLSCQGCHQTHGVAGFHFLGLDDHTRRADIVAVAHSRHFGEDAQRRAVYLEQLAASRVPDERRPSVERMGAGDHAAHCGLDPAGPLSNWTCEPGLECRKLVDPQVGVCEPSQRAAGDSCETGTLRHEQNPHKDYVALAPQHDCGPTAVCERNSVGFPGGMCSADCSTLGDGETCGAIAQLVAFNDCLARNEAFESCILQNTRPGALRACDEQRPCREDYICARMPNGSGGCIPPYFLFQMRVDGHVLR